jgi:ATP/maltotriose-dependent transcriptional regulator MalT
MEGSRAVNTNSLSTDTVVGREEELAATRRFLDAVPEGPAAMVIEGEAGIGKTTVWRQATRDAEATSYRVLSCRPAESETKLSFASLADLMGPVADEVLPELPEPQRRALEAALLRAELESGPPDQRSVATGFVSTLKALSGTAPVLVAVDDVPWLDGPTRRVLEFAARRLGGAPVGVLVARRGGSDAPAPLALDGATPEKRLERCCLGPLSAAALHQLLKENLGLSLPRPTLVRLEQACGGNPFYALEIAAALQERGEEAAATDRLPVPGDVCELVSKRIGRMPTPTQEALLEASGLSQPTLDLLDEDALAPAEEAELIAIGDDGHISFSHPIFAAAVYEAASAPRRRRLHQRLAERVTAVEEQARHLALASQGPDPSVADILDRAAAQARSRGAPDAAADLMEESCRLTPPHEVDELRRRLIDAAEHHYSAGDLGRARRLLSELVSDPDCGAARPQARFLLARVCHYEHSFPDALDLLEKARKEAGDDRRLGAAIDFELAYVHECCGDIDGAEGPAKRALAQAERLGPSPLLAQALAVTAIVDFLLGRGLDDRIDQALALEDPDSQVPVMIRPSLIAGHLDLYVGELDRAGDRLYALHRRVIERGEETELPYVCTTLAWLECRRGDLEAAARVAEEGLDSARQLESEPLVGYALACDAFVDGYRGRESAARAIAGEALAHFEQTGWGHIPIWTLAGLGVLELSLGDFEAADRALAPLVQRVESTGLREPIHAFWLPDGIEALIGLGSLERAERLLGMLESRAQLLERTWALAAGARCRGQLIAAQGDLDAARGKLDEALGQHERTGMPIELARTMLVKGQIERRARRKAKARESLQGAQEIFERHGARLWAERASTELESLGLRRVGSEDLSPIERRVAGLAASGLTNREIASELFISPKTVEAHLGHTYRKLGIRSRAQLGGQLAGGANGQPPRP